MEWQEIEGLVATLGSSFAGRSLDFEEFRDVLGRMAKLDARCEMSEDVIRELYDFVLVKQYGTVTFEVVIGLTLEILRERTSLVASGKALSPSSEQPNYDSEVVQRFKPRSSSHEALWSRIAPIVEFITSDIMHQMKYIYQQCLEGNQDVDVDILVDKIQAMDSLEDQSKGDIEIFFKLIQNEDLKVTPSSLASLMSLLEEFWLSTFTSQQDEATQQAVKLEEKSATANATKNKASSVSPQPNSSNKKEYSSEPESNMLALDTCNDYIGGLSYGIDVLKEQKGKSKKYYSTLDEMINNVQMIGAKIDAYEVVLQSNQKVIQQERENTMNAESKLAYIESEQRRIVEYREELERQIDGLAEENERLANGNESLLIELEAAELTAREVNKTEAKSASLFFELEKEKKRSEELRKSSEQLREESDRLFELVKDLEKRLEEQQQRQQGSHSAESEISELKEKLRKERESGEKLKDEKRAALLKTKIIEEEFRREQAQLAEKESLLEQLKEEYKYVEKQLQSARAEGRVSLAGKWKSQLTAGRPSVQGIHLTAGRTSVRNRQSIGGFGSRSSLAGKALGMQNTPTSGGRPSEAAFKLDPRISFNYSTRGSVFEDRLSRIDRDSIQSTQTKQSEVNFDHFWNQFEQRKSVMPSIVEKMESSNFSQSQSQSQSLAPSILPGVNLQDISMVSAEQKLTQYSRDFLGIRESKKVKNLLEKYKDIDDPSELRCFSDSIFRINNNNDRERRILFATPLNIFILHPSSMKVVRCIQIARIKQMSFINRSAYLCVLAIKQEYDYLIETYRRADFNMYLLSALRASGLPPYQVAFTDETKIQFRGVKEKIKLSEMNEKTLLNRFQAAYKTASVGFMDIFNHNWLNNLFTESWKEYFFVLANIGLISFSKPGDSKPILFIPISEALIVQDPAGTERKHCIKISYQGSEQHYILACKSKDEQEQWVQSLRKVIYTSVNQNAKIDHKVQKICLATITDTNSELDEIPELDD